MTSAREGEALRAQRTAAGLSQARLAEIAEIAQHQLSGFELGKRPLAAEKLRRLREILADSERIKAAGDRPKRYRRHVYSVRAQDPERKARHRHTPGNPAYLAALAELERPPPPSFGALSLFAGCGGLSLGFRSAGCAVKGFVEIDDGLAGLFQTNFPEARRLGGDVRAVTDREIDAFLEVHGPVEALIGGPPCQGFSLAGKRSAEDPRNALFREYVRILGRLRPKVALMENVRKLTSMRGASGGWVRDEILEAFRAEGYEVRLFAAEAADHGVPQRRERIFFLAVDRALRKAPSFPEPLAGPWRSFGDACSDLEFLEAGERGADPLHAAVTHPDHVVDWLWETPEGASAHENPDPARRPPSGYNTTYKRQVWSEPAAAVQTTFGMISGSRNVHPIATRALTAREAARLQSFPDGWRFEGTLGTIRTGLGNATPPLLAKAIAEHVRREILGL